MFLFKDTNALFVILLQTQTGHQLLAYADDVNLLGENIDTTNKNKETVI
jgi:hypothetical protein